MTDEAKPNRRKAAPKKDAPNAAKKKAPVRKAKAPTKEPVKAEGPRGRPTNFQLPEDHPLEVAARILPGGKNDVAAALGMNRNNLRGIERRVFAGSPFPIERVMPICAVTGQRPADFRPDVFHESWKIPGVAAPKTPRAKKAA